jgi:transposase
MNLVSIGFYIESTVEPQKVKKVIAEIPGKHFVRQSIVAAQCGKKIIAALCYQGTCNTILFNFWIKAMLVPELKPGQIVIVDNAAIHKSEETKKLIEGVDSKLMFLPPYSPDLNPIEHYWAWLKKKIRDTVYIRKTLDEAISNAMGG